MEPLVAEESKDKWFASEKIRYGNFEIGKIEFNENETRAKVIVLAETTMRVRDSRFTGKAPMVSNWMIENGEWRYFIPADDHGIEARKVRIPKPNELLGKVTASKNEVRLCSCGEPVFDVIIQNAMPGEVQLILEPVDVPGLRVTLKDTVLKSQQSTKLLLEYDGAEKPPAAPVPLTLNVLPTGERIVVNLVFATTN